MKFSKRTGWILFLLCMFVLSASEAEIQVKMEPLDWNWEADSTAVFQGVIQTDGEDISGAVMKLKVETRLDDSGEILFTNLNGKKLKVRKRSNEVETDLIGDNAENTFEGEWYLPADMAEGLSYASIILSVYDADGKELIVSEMHAGSQNDDNQVSTDTSMTKRLENLIFYIFIISIVVWLAAFGRYSFIRWRQMRKE